MTIDEFAERTIERCAKIAELHFRQERGELDRGYNKAIREISAAIRQLNRKEEAA
jgi:hypothetical protein